MFKVESQGELSRHFDMKYFVRITVRCIIIYCEYILSFLLLLNII